MKIGFIKDTVLLEEKISDIDYLDFSSSIETLSKKLSVSDKSIMLGVVGPFGVGESTLISKVKDSRKEEGEEWIHFDAWQFPDRKELWEGLILETAKNQEKFQPILEEITGTHHDGARTLINTIGDIPIPGLSVIKNLNHFIKTSPATRVFQLQDIFTDLINSIEKDKIVFVLEDVDRSGDAGLFFLETFRQFLNNNELNKKIIVIVAISNESYFEKIDTYLKCLDFVEFFHKKSDTKLTNFISSVFESIEENDTSILVDFFNYMFTTNLDLNIRKIKLILRQANLDYVELQRKGFSPNPLVCIGVTTSKYIKNNDADKDSLYDHFIKQKTVTSGNAIARMILITNKNYLRYTDVLIVNRKNELENTFDINLVQRDTPENIIQYPSTPYNTNSIYSEDNESKVCLPDFYFKNL